MYKSLSLFIIRCTSFFICSKQLSWFCSSTPSPDPSYFSLFFNSEWHQHAFSYSNQKPRFHFYCLLSWFTPNWPARFTCSTSKLYLQSSIHFSSSLTTSLGKYLPTSPSMSILELPSKSTFYHAARACTFNHVTLLLNNISVVSPCKFNNTNFLTLVFLSPPCPDLYYLS